MGIGTARQTQRRPPALAAPRPRKFDSPSPRRGAVARPGPRLGTRAGCGGREGLLHTPTRQVAATSGGQWRKAAGGRGRYSHGLAGLEQLRDPGQRLRPDSDRRAQAARGHLPQRRAWVRGQRAAGQGSFGAPDRSRGRRRVRPPAPQPQREPGSGQEAGARRREPLRGRRPRRRHPGPAWPQPPPPPPPPAGPADGQSEAPGAEARAGRRAEERRASAPALGQGPPARGRLRSSPGARAARAGRAGRLGKRRGRSCARPGRGPAPPPRRSLAAQCGVGAAAREPRGGASGQPQFRSRASCP